jgi:two-component system OmpR family response regulator
MENPGSILVVDDDPEIRELLANFLSRHGYHAATAEDAVAMDAVLATQSVDLLVLDLMLPGEDGLSICRRLRADTSIPIIMLTAVSEETDRIVGLEMGADDYLVKPFNPRELLARIKAVLRRSDQAESLGTGKQSILAVEGWNGMLTGAQ